MASQVIISPDSYYSMLHNDYLHLLEVDGKRYKSPTHFIYAAMMPDKNTGDAMKYQLTGAAVRKKVTGYLFGKKVKGERKLANASEFIINKALYDGYKVLFNQPDLRDKLLGTGNEGIVYIRDKHTFLPGDITVLGLNRAGNGQNKLGLILEGIRSDIRKDVIARQKPPQQLHQIDRLYFAILRRKLLLAELSKGHFPPAYTLKELYMASRNISPVDFGTIFIAEHPGGVREGYWNIYVKGVTEGFWSINDSGVRERLQGIEPVIINEFQTGNDEWIADEYNLAIKKKCVLIEYLRFLKIDYEVLLTSIAKQKILNDYQTRKFEFDKKTSSFNQISMIQYLEKYKITPDTLRYIGEESLSDLRESVYTKYVTGGLLSISNFEENLASSIEGLRGIITQSIVFPKFIPHIEAPSEKFLDLVALDVPLEPVSPRQTYGGISVAEYYSPIHPDGACSDEVNAVCPIPGMPYEPTKPSGGGDSDDDGDEDDGGKGGKGGGKKGGNDSDGEEFDQDEPEEEEWDEEEKDVESDDDNDGTGRGGGDGGNVEPISEDNAVFGDDQDIDKAIVEAVNKPFIKKYLPPVVTVRFSDENDYPYEWLSPFYISHIRIDGLYYPSVAHYVIAKLATPIQFRNVSIRDWIQKEKGGIIKDKLADTLKDSYTSPTDFHSLDILLEKLPERIQDIYNLLYVRYANRALDIKFRNYPFRQILFDTGNAPVVYYDDNNQNAVAGKELVRIITDIRSKIDDIVIRKPLPNPVYGRENLVLYDYIRERTRELLRSTILFTRYRISPRINYMDSTIPIVSYEDARFAINKLYLSCRDINYTEYVSPPPEMYITDFETDLTDLIKLYFPNRTMYDTKHPDVANAIKMKLSGLSEDDMNDKVFVNVTDIMKMVWVHIVYTCIFLQEELPEIYEQNQLRQRIKMIRTSIFKLSIGTRKEVAVRAASNIISQLHQYFSQQPQLEDSELEFLQDFLYPLEYTRQDTKAKIEESESYNTYGELTNGITKIFGNNEQSTSAMKKLAFILDGITGVSQDDKILFNKLTIRLKFFGSMDD
jgi:predicted NAD-dependent protein-ADP-ribosyltransferase YbiA (DUF1768 family)